jgi:hypothetical protein
MTAQIAAARAALIPPTLQLPPGPHGEPLAHLSASSVGLFYRCPEAWRRRYLLGESEVPSGEMALGSSVDEALSEHCRALAAGERRALADTQQQALEALRRRCESEEVRFGQTLDRASAERIAPAAIAVALSELLPAIGEPIAAQRRVELALSAAHTWTVLGYIDLEARAGERETLCDWKLAGSPLSQARADRDLQAGVYLLARWCEGRAAQAFCFAQILRPGGRREKPAGRLVWTDRSAAQLRGVRARLAAAAAHISALYERLGAQAPWPLADPGHWLCSRAHCGAWERCPGGQGL